MVGEFRRCVMEAYKVIMVRNIPRYSRPNRIPADGDLWVAYGVNKEDMWVSLVFCSGTDTETLHAADDDFSKAGSIAELTDWNILLSFGLQSL